MRSIDDWQPMSVGSMTTEQESRLQPNHRRGPFDLGQPIARDRAYTEFSTILKYKSTGIKGKFEARMPGLCRMTLAERTFDSEIAKWTHLFCPQIAQTSVTYRRTPYYINDNNNFLNVSVLQTTTLFLFYFSPF